MAEEQSDSSSLFYLHEVLEEEILVRLPIKSIVRFESVCKRWYSLFRSKAFPEFYYSSGHHQLSIFTKKDMRLYPELRPSGRRRCRGRLSMTSAMGPLNNGIYALTSVLKNTNTECLFPHTLKVALFNPATRRFKFAAPFPDEYFSRLAGISSHECVASCGVDDYYRVVVLIKYDSGSPMDNRICFLALLYTWRTGEWEIIVDYNPGRKRLGLPPGTNVFKGMIYLTDDMTACARKLLNGCWHWLVVKFDCLQEENLGRRFEVLTLDFESKLFGSISGPPCEHSFCADVFVLQDHLAAIVVPESLGHQTLMQIWIKGKDPEILWTNVFSVDPLDVDFYTSIFYGVDYYPVQEPEPEFMRIKSLTLLFHGKLVTYDDRGDHQVAYQQDSDQIPLSLAGISTFKPTLEPLPDFSQVICKLQCTDDYTNS